MVEFCGKMVRVRINNFLYKSSRIIDYLKKIVFVVTMPILQEDKSCNTTH